MTPAYICVAVEACIVTACTGLHGLNLLELQNQMQTYHLDAPNIPEYVNMLEDAVKRAKRAKQNILPKALVVIASAAMLK